MMSSRPSTRTKYASTCNFSVVVLQLGPVKEYVKMLTENADVKFIVFGHHRVMLDSITEQLVDDNITFIRIDGSTLAVDRAVYQ